MKYFSSAYIFVFLGLFGGLSATADAAVIRYEGEMVATSSGGGMNVGDRVVFGFDFDADKARRSGWGPNVVTYEGMISNESYWTNGNVDLTGAKSYSVAVYQNYQSYVGYTVGVKKDGWTYLGINLPYWLTSYDAPSRLPELSETISSLFGTHPAFQQGGNMQYWDGSRAQNVSFDLTRFEQVPAPAALFLMVLGLVAVGLVRRKNLS